MTKQPLTHAQSEWKALFIKRVKSARERMGYSQEAMATALDIKQDKYKQYEGRSLMPHYMIPRFCLVAHIEIERLFDMPPRLKKSTPRAGRVRSRRILKFPASPEKQP